MNEIENATEIINSRLDQEEKTICELQDNARYILWYVIIKLSIIKNKESFLKVVREKKLQFTRESPLGYQWISQQTPFRLEESGIIYSKH